MGSKLDRYVYDCYNLGELFFQNVGDLCGIHLGVGDRFLIGRVMKERGEHKYVEESYRAAVSHLVLFGYDSAGLREEYQLLRSNRDSFIREWRRKKRVKDLKSKL